MNDWYLLIFWTGNGPEHLSGTCCSSCGDEMHHTPGSETIGATLVSAASPEGAISEANSHEVNPGDTVEFVKLCPGVVPLAQRMNPGIKANILYEPARLDWLTETLVAANRQIHTADLN